MAIAYGGVWLAVVDAVLGDLPLDRDLGAVRAGPVAVLLHPVAADRPGDHHGLRADAMSGRASSTRSLALEPVLSRSSMRLSPGTLFGEAVLGLLNPETTHARRLRQPGDARCAGQILGAPLPFDQSLLLIWPQITGLIAGMIVVFAAAYIVFQREEVRA